MTTFHQKPLFLVVGDIRIMCLLVNCSNRCPIIFDLFAFGVSQGTMMSKIISFEVHRATQFFYWPVFLQKVAMGDFDVLSAFERTH